jgi:hypothetical protein
MSPTLQEINAVIKACVEVVDGPPRKENPQTTYRFDAYYNAATGRVHTNVDQLGYVSQRSLIFKFEKCMAERGMPLGGKQGGL